MPFEPWFSRPINLWLTMLSSLTLLHICTNQMKNGDKQKDCNTTPHVSNQYILETPCFYSQFSVPTGWLTFC